MNHYIGVGVGAALIAAALRLDRMQSCLFCAGVGILVGVIEYGR